MTYQIDENGNVICSGEPDCEGCEDFLCFQQYDEETEQWVEYCPECLDTMESTLVDYQDTPQDGEPTESYPSGVVPVGGVKLECGAKSKIFTHHFKKTYSFDVGGGYPWSNPIMVSWTAAQRQSHMDQWAGTAGNIPNATFAEWALDAFNDAKAQGKDAGITCDKCPDGVKACPRKVIKGTVKASSLTVSGTTMYVTGTAAQQNQVLHVKVTLEGDLKIYVHCDKADC